ncbi:TetR/AcrR family transcriptional regulator [Anaerovibrio sp.]|uniref:TetR/AcrR family transcriptional regulator n=1 Tax=Anaerovibrio sp. TaxID=1872532 RepID=UPI003F186A3F
MERAVKGKRQQRDDGRQTRDRLLECAGILAAQKGFSLVTSKEICKLAGTNLAAINYHFGSREGLYEELLYRIHQYMVNEDRLREMVGEDSTPGEKISALVDMVAEQVWSQENWQMQVWSREVMHTSQSAHVSTVLMQVIKVKGSLALKMFSDYTGLAMDDIRLYMCFLCFMAPIMLVAFGKHSTIEYSRITHASCSDKEMLGNIKQFCFAGLDSYRRQ